MTSPPPPPPGYSASDIVPAGGTMPPPPPGYSASDIVPSGPATPTATISATPQPQSLADKVTQWGQNVAYDLKHGTDLTGVGHVLKAMGAHGLDYGNSDAVGSFMGSLPLGLAKAVQGEGEIDQGNIGRGAKDIASGSLQAATLPAAFVAPEAPEAASTAFERLPIPTAAKAGKLFNEVMGAAKDVPVNLTRAQPALDRVAQLTDAGAPVMTAPNKLLLRSQTVNPIPYQEARDFYSNISNLSAQDKLALNGPMKKAVGALREAFKQDIGDTAASVGKGAQYDKAMTMYHAAARNADAIKTAAKYALPLGGGYEVLRILQDILGRKN